MLNGHVNTFAQVGDQMIVGGSFSQVKSGSVTYNRRNLFAFDIATGEISTDVRSAGHGRSVRPRGHARARRMSWRSEASVRSIRPADQPRRRDQRHHGAVASTFKPPMFDKIVRDIEFAHGQYYVVGDFTKAGTVARSGLASFGQAGS